MSEVAVKPKTSPKISPQAKAELEWHNKFNELCYELFYKNNMGQQFLTMCEHKYFYAPTAFPGKDIAWTWLNEGRNDFIRSIRNGINIFTSQPSTKKEQGNVKRTKDTK